jgi:hypothetical protein
MIKPYWLIGLALVAAACSSGEVSPRGEGRVEITAGIDTPTKALTPGFDAPYGIFACLHEDVPHDFLPFKPATYNARVHGGNVNYTVSLADGALDENNSPHFVLTSRPDVNEGADLYAYSPWMQEAWQSGPTAIPFTAGQDVMYAVQNAPAYVPGASPDRKNTNLNPALDTPPLKATFYFRHMMARLVFCFRLVNEPTSYEVTTIRVTDQNPAGGTAKLIASGTYNAIEGTFNPGLEEAQSCDFNVPNTERLISSSTTERTMSLLLVPTSISTDDELSFTFIMADGDKFPPFVLKKEQVRHADDTYGFRAGYTYTFHFTLDNYVYFNGFSIDENWEPAGTDLLPEEI